MRKCIVASRLLALALVGVALAVVPQVTRAAGTEAVLGTITTTIAVEGETSNPDALLRPFPMLVATRVAGAVNPANYEVTVMQVEEALEALGGVLTLASSIQYKIVIVNGQLEYVCCVVTEFRISRTGSKEVVLVSIVQDRPFPT